MTANYHTVADQPDEPMDLTDLPPPSTSNVAQDAVSTSAMPFAEPQITAAPKSKAQKQRDYRHRIAASRTPAEVITARAVETARKRNYRLRVAANSALADGSLQSTTASSSSATGRSTLAAEPVQTTVQLSTSLDLVEVQQAQSTWNPKRKRSIKRFKSTLLDNEFGYSITTSRARNNRWSARPELIKKAVQYIIKGDSFYKTYKKTGISPTTVKKFYLLYKSKPNLFKEMHARKKEIEDRNARNNLIFTEEQESALLKCLKQFEYLFYGLSLKECRMLAYQMVIVEDLKIPVGWKYGMASITWLTGFQQKHTSFMFNLKKPDRICTRYKRTRIRTPANRNILWEKKSVSNFYDNLETSFQISPQLKDSKRIYSLDEAYTSIYRETKVVRKINSDLITICCFICADGTSLPPVIIKPNLPYIICSDIPPGAVAFTGSHGQMTPDLFTEVMHHFVKTTHSSLSNPSTLIMDTDLCHLSYSALNLAKESGVNIITLHQHTSKLLQPLQGEIFELFYKCYDDAMKESWVQPTESCDFGKMISEAYSKAMTFENINNGFKKCGINPFDRDLFTDTDYLSCLDHIDQTCVECGLRENRKLTGKFWCRKSTDNGVMRKNSEVRVEDSHKLTGDEGKSSHSLGQEFEAVDQIKSSDCATMTPPRTQSGQELDKLKRRLIRSIARLIKEKKTEEEVWDELKKECGTNCKTLWLRMRSLTLKKLKRLLDAQDRNDLVPAVARMTLTDWLLYDLVLVHEKIDVINRASGDDKVMSTLFSLVQMFQIEGRTGDDLAEAWTAATVTYNSKGHQCSPMLMQRRWYQIKELTRHKLYQFWFNYRGNERLLINAKQDPPTPLQRDISLRYPELITQAFPTWEERIEQKLVIMPEEFEVKMRNKDFMKPSNESVPDVVIVEQKIDTITVDSDSEFDDDEKSIESALLEQEVTGNDDSSQAPIMVQVKTEPEDPADNIDIIEHSVYPEKPKDRFQDAIERLKAEEDRIAMSHITAEETSEDYCVMPLITSVMGAVDETVTMQDLSTFSKDMVVDSENPTEIDSTINDTLETNIEFKGAINDDRSQESIVIDDDDDVRPIEDAAQNKSNIINQIKHNDDVTCSQPKRIRVDNNEMASIAQHDNSIPFADTGPSVINEVCPVITAIASGSPVKTKMEMISGIENQKNVDEEMWEDLEDSDDLIEDIIKMGPEKEFNVDSGKDVMIETNFATDGFEFADDGIEYYEEYNNHSELAVTPSTQQEGNSADASSPKFDLKLLMHPVVYTTKLDKMKAFKNRSYIAVNEKELFDRIILESKPVTAKSVNVDQNKVATDSEKFEETMDNIEVKAEKLDEFNDDLFQNETSKESDGENLQTSYDDIKRVKLSSSLLQKPRSRSYNPIQLCKNPDFNTRLKRLPLGFFSYNRNRGFLKACKPMTIDLSKAFESKLINGTMYLKPSDTVVDKQVKDMSETATSIMPSAVPVQSLMDTADVDKLLEEELTRRMLERNKTINLPNISVVRQINQQLLMAEVAPILTKIEKSSPDVINTVNSVENPPKENANILPINPIKQLAPVTNSAKPTKETLTNIIQPLLPMMNNDKANEDKTIDKQRKKWNRSNTHRPLWSTKNYYDCKPYGESLLTIDTLYKVINALDPTSEYYKPKTKSHKKITQSKASKPVGIRLEDSSNNITTDSDNQTEQPTTNTSTKALQTLNQPTINPFKFSKPKKIKDNGKELPRKRRCCCWARSKINKLNGITMREPKHKCPASNCKCCCREILRQTEINNEIRLLEQMQKRDSFDETIEQVVQQSRESLNVTLPKGTKIPLTPILVSINQKTQNLADIEISPDVRHPFNTHLKPQSNPKSISPNVNIQTDGGDDDDVVEINDTEDRGPQINIDRVFSVPEISTEITINVDDEEDNKSTLEIQTPKPKIRVHAAKANKLQTKLLTSPTVVPAASSPSTVAPIAPLPRISKVRLKGLDVAKAPAPMFLPKDPEDVLPCSCRPNVGIDKQSAMLVVDGSNECPRHTKSRVSKETRIYLNRKHMSGSARPFYVGKNKILLTNITPLKSKMLRPLPLAPPAPSGPVEIPAGVQVVLLPDGSISYLVDPAIKLTPEQMNAMPQILTTVRQQINASGIKLPENGGLKIIDSTNDTNMNENRPQQNNNENEESTTANLTQTQLSSNSDRIRPDLEKKQELPPETDTVLENQAEIQLCQESSDKNNTTIDVMNSTTDEEELRLSKGMSLDNETIAMAVAGRASSVCSISPSNVDNLAAGTKHNTTESTEINDPVPELGSEKVNNAVTSSSRNLLSDLMEMSGILEEDVTPVQQQPSNTVPESIQPLTIDITQNSSIQPVSDAAPPLSPTDQQHLIAAQINEKIYNLNPITSFAELKHACDNNGLFFKLDLNNGLIVPINVCIQKTPEVPSVKNTMPAEVIDLTEEHSFIVENSPDNISSNIQGSSGFQKTPNPKVYRSTRPEIQKTKVRGLLTPQAPRPRGRGRPRKHENSILIEDQSQFEAEVSPAPSDAASTSLNSKEKKISLMKRLSNNLKPLKIQYDKRTSINILRKNSLLSNTPILKRISNLGNRVEASIKGISYETSSDDSDDEPLAKIANRMRTTETNETTNEESQRVSDTKVDEDDENVDFEDAIDAISSVVPPTRADSPLRPHIPNVDPVPTQLVLSGPALQQPLPTMMDGALSLDINEYREDSDGDCILGV